MSLRTRVLVWRLRWKHTRRTGRPRAALRLLWNGDHDRARTKLVADKRPRARFELACVELHAGDGAAAERALRDVPDDPARAVLAALIALRAPSSPYRASGDDSWHAALVAAWRDAGSPDLRGNAYVGDDDFRESHDDGSPARLAATERRLWSWMTHRIGMFRYRYPRALRRWAEHVEQGDIAEVAVAQHVLTQRDDPRTRELRIALLDRLCGTFPDSMWLRLCSLGLRRSGPLEPPDLEELEAAAAARNLDATVSPLLFERFEAIARGANSSCPAFLGYRAMIGSLFVTPAASIVLRLAQTDKTHVRAAAELCVRIGRRMREDRWLITFLFGAAMMRAGGRALGRQQIFNEFAPHNDEHQKFRAVAGHLKLDAMRFPLPALSIDMIGRMRANELSYYRELLKP